MGVPISPTFLPGPIFQDEFPAQTLWHDLALGFMKFHPMALALVPKVTRLFSPVLTMSAALWQLPPSLLHKGHIGNIEL